MELELDLDFKRHFAQDHFFFGVANAPYLCEGGYNTPDGPKNSYGALERRGVMEPSGDAVRFWTNYEEQIQLAASLGLTAFRMGIEWARIQPTTRITPHDPPLWDEAALERYADIIACVTRHKMEPVITLHHFLHPAWLPEDMWLSDEGPDLLAAYQLRAVEEINRRLVQRGSPVMAHFLVYNEPDIVPQIYHAGKLFPELPHGPEVMMRAFDNMFSRYVRVYDGLYDLFEREGWGTPHVGFTIASMCFYELDKLFADVVRLRSFGASRAQAETQVDACRAAWYERMDPLARSKLNDEQYRHYQEIKARFGNAFRASALPKTLDALYASSRVKKLDYLSINVYEPFFLVKGFVWWELAADPEVYRTFIHASNDFNTDLPFYMGENSLAYRQPVGQPAEPRPDGWNRERYLKTYLMAMVRCIKEGVPIRGYLYWSLVDDFEWDSGFAPRLGLYNYDYVNHRILPTDGLGEPAGQIYAHLIAALRSGDKATIQNAFTLAYKHARVPQKAAEPVAV
jgi:beta-glucosidase